MALSGPTLTGFIAWTRTAMGVPVSVLPDDSVYFQYAYDVALEIVNQQLNGISTTIYTLAVYNLGGDNLINWAQDADGAPVFQDNLPYFAYLRQQYGVFNFIPGVVSSTSDEGTSMSLEVSERLKNLTIAQLQNLKTPYGRQYLSWAMSWGTNWGIS